MHINVSYFARFLAVLAAGLALAGPGRAAQRPDPAVMVKSTSDQVIKALKEKNYQGPERRAALLKLVDEIVLPHFDFTRMSQWVMARNWRTMTPAQQKQFVQLFRDLLVRTYSNSLTNYRDQKIEVSGTTIDPASGDALVRMVVRQNGNEADVPIVYRLYWTGSDWKVYDVTIDNVSLVTNYRASFGRIASQQGIDALLDRLQQRAKEAG